MALDVLIVDNDAKIIVRNLGILLPQEKFTLHTARSGEQAIDQLKGRDYSMIVLDYNMGIMDGLETAKALRAIKPKTRMIGFSSSWDKDKASAAGLEFYAPDQHLIATYISENLN